ncbi:hypothetical protein [Bacillus cereus group sp. BfR-BA-00999]|uniref:hypothetical protein n=1 Tax=Bacillus cereus group sp. BfR-BA-00999 TaxID=3094871 RepID=UPI0029C131D5|nr:hypothetical protein [Bacillus cereus group sp. BfR-BA-00999]MDX5884933.1 hypothetical protein [Bacillus cereus group sp. BfR-BA-00999]
MKKRIMILTLSIAVLAGCEDIRYEQTTGDAKVVEKWERTEIVSGVCYPITVGDISTVVCDSDTEETHYNVKIEFDGINATLDNKALYDSNATSIPVAHVKEFGKETGEFKKEYLKRIGD